MDVTSVGLTASITSGNTSAHNALPPHEASQRRELVKAIGTVNAHQALGPHGVVTFIVDPSTRRLITRVVNPDTKEVLMQVPPDYILRLAAFLQNKSNQADK